MTKTKTRLISAVIAVLVVAAALFLLLPSVLSTTASGEVWSGQLATTIATGNGTEENPYKIKTAEELAFMASKVNSGEAGYPSAHYKLTADIVLNESLDGTPNEWTAIGTYLNPFTGKFDGNGHTISGIVINSTTAENGLFGCSKGTIMNVGVLDSSISGGDSVGGVCGYNYGTITNCYSTGAVSGTGVDVGGVCGWNEGTITNCYSTGAVSGSSYVGGVCGRNYEYSTIEYCYSTGAVSGNADVGGVCGSNGGTIEYCYYNTDFYTGNAIGSDSGILSDVTGISTAALCGSTLPTGFGSAVWTAGSAGDVTEIEGNYGKRTYTFPSLIGVGSAYAFEADVYNFGTDEAPDWDIYTKISTEDELIALSTDRAKWSGNYVLTSNITLTAPTEGGSNWTAIGTEATHFTGKFSGDGHTISGIVINKSRNDYQGLFGYSEGTIMNVGVINSSISGNNWVGGVCGYNDGTITNCYSTGAVSGSRNYVGGVCGQNYGTIENCYSTGAVSGAGSPVGGVCGYNYGTIKNCYSTGAVSGSSYVGGVCGRNYSNSTITNCYSTGEVSGTGECVGGVCGKSDNGTIENCYSTGEVSGSGDYVGGVCGYNNSTIKNCYSTGAVSGSGDYVGGVCGYNDKYSTIENCYSIGAVSGRNLVGGVCGKNSATITNCYYDKDFCSEGGIQRVDVIGSATGKTTAELCGSLPTGFDPAVWTAGGYTEDGKKATATFPHLKVFENTSAPKPTVLFYNFGTNGSDDWKTYTEISTADELIALSKDNTKWRGNYVLTADITLTAPAQGESNWTAIGTSSTKFTGKFSGDGHTVSGIVINKSDENDQGLFGYSTGLIMNVGVIDSSISGGNDVGGVCGSNGGTITNCYSTGAVSGSGNDVGGVCGWNDGTIKNCYSTGAVSGASNYVGGVCGDNYGTITNCYSTGAVSGSGNDVGGVCGRNDSNGTIKNCYYDADFYTGNAIADAQGTVTDVTGISTTALCGSTLPEYLSLDNWTAGSFTIDPEDGKKATATFPQLKVFENTSTPKTTLSLYNFGTEEAPDWDTYTEISTADELIALSKDSTKWSGNYVLTADITLTAPTTDGSNWTAIGNGTTKFTGKFSGDGHTISGIVINSTSDNQGLFGWSKGTIINVGVINSSISGGSNVGGVCGRNEGGTITNCYSTGTVTGSGYHVGGVCGYNYGTIENCYSTGAVSGTSNYVGGVCGNNDSNSTIKNCYSTGAVSGNYNVGGVCGGNYSNSTITNCYSTGTVSGENVVGGVCGQNNSDGTIKNCYYDADFYTGNAIGYNSGTETNVTGISTTALCGSTLPEYLSLDNWTAGSYSADGKKATATFPQLKVFENTSAPTPTVLLYNFGTEEAPDWDTYTEISTAEALQNINNNLSGNYVLTANITLTAPENEGDSNWNAIGTSSNPFTGKFDGNGHTISGIVINKSDEINQGLFGWSKGTIMNVGVLDSSISGDNYVGGVCGQNQGGTITNCYSTGTVSGTSNVGGVCGNNTGTIKNCYSTGEVSAAGDVGGVCGYNYGGTITNCYSTGAVSAAGDFVGGVCGHNDYNSTITNCYSTGAVSGKNVVGGVSGGNGGGTITNCYSTGAVSAAEDFVGGVCGNNDSNSTITNCYSTGAVSGNYNVGGVCGNNDSNSTIKNCYSTGAVSAAGDVGGVCGQNDGTITSCYYDKDFCSVGGINGSDVSGSATGKTTAELCDSTLPAGFETSVWTAGSYLIDGKKATATLPQLKVFENTSAPTPTILFYNFGTNGSDDWDTYTEISTAEALKALSNDSTKWSGNYVLTANITLTAPTTDGSNWTAIGNGTTKFTGKFSGDGHTISGIVINKSGEDYQGLFGYSKGTIMNVGVINSSISGKDYVGGVCGYNMDGTIKNCYNTGAVSATGNSVGGVCGGKYNCTITNCYNTGTVSGINIVGGVCGDSYGYNITIENCYSTGAVSGTNTVGGICGFNKQGTITNCYYDTDFYTGNAISENNGTATNVTGISTADLCGSTLPTGFDPSVWNVGSVGDVTEIVGNFGKKTYTFPSLIGVGSAATYEEKFYNFGTNGSDDWQIYTEISTADELIALSNNSSKWGGNYVLTADITLTAPEAGSSNWTAIGTPTAPFTGKFSGDGHTISGIVINSTSHYQGLFGYLYINGTIMNVGVVDSSISGVNYVGGVCGFNDFSTIKNCYSTGEVSGSSYVGGVCGDNNLGIIKNCYSTGTVSGTGDRVGGVCGLNDRGSTENCYYLEGCSADGTTFTSTEGTSKTETQFKNGSVCYLLNGSTSTNPVWYQLLETENYPNLDSTNSANRTVYQCAPCTGVFSNTEVQTAEHSCVVDTNDSTKHICEKCEETHNAAFTADDTADTISICHGFGTVTLKAPTGNLTYDGKEKAAAVEGKLTGFDTPKILYKLKDSAEAAVETAPINAGTYVASITYTDADSNEHSVSVEYTIAKAAVTITANSYTIKVGDTLPTFDYEVSGLVNGEELEVTPELSCEADTSTAGTYTITVKFNITEDEKYIYTVQNGTLTVEKKSPTTPTNPTDPTNPTNPTNNEPQIKGDNGKTGWDVILGVIEDTKDGGTVTVDMNGTTELPEKIISEISGKDINLVLDMGNGFVWTINGKSVTDPKDVDMGVNRNTTIPVKVINALTGECEYITISLAHSGEFGFTAVLTVDMGEKNQGLFANLYYYNDESEKTEFICSDKIGSNGTADLTFTHASEYVVVLDDHDHGKTADGSTTTSDTTADGDTNPSTGVTMVFGAALISGAAIMISRKKKK